jgi:farnesyl diphosphate synthase
MQMTPDFDAILDAQAARVDAALGALLQAAHEDRLLSAMRYAVLGAGKRLRPFVVISSATLFGVEESAAMRTACALECVHAYSLVHDDLPAMDDDDMRRGRPTVHRAFDEATAILAGDGLSTVAFEILATTETHPRADVRAELVLALAQAAGAQGMIGGQMRDLAAEGRFSPDGRPLRQDESATLALQEMKTAALFRFAAEAGAILGGAAPDDRARMARFGRALGLAFQIADDILDEEATAVELGKATAKDRARGKATLPAVLGRDAARMRLQSYVTEASDALQPYGASAEHLAAAARFAATRRR